MMCVNISLWLVLALWCLGVNSNPEISNTSTESNNTVISASNTTEPPRLIIDSIYGFPPVTYFTDTERRSEKWNPLIMRHAAENSPASTLWRDNEYFLKMEDQGEEELSMTMSYFKPHGPLNYFINDLYVEEGSFVNFVKSQEKGGLSIATTLPPRLRKDILVPCPLQCTTFMDELLVDSFLWMGKKGVATKIHTEALANIICLYRGDMKIILLDSVAWERYHKRADNSIFDTLPLQVELSANDTHEINLSNGDCLFIPENTAYYAQSSENILALSILWKNAAQVVSSSKCKLKCSPSQTLDTVTLEEYHQIEQEIGTLKTYVETLRTSQFETPLKHMEERMKEFAEFDIHHTRNGQMLRHLANETLEIVDKNRDSVFSDGEVKSMTKSEWLSFGYSKTTLEHVLEHFNHLVHLKHDEL